MKRQSSYPAGKRATAAVLCVSQILLVTPAVGWAQAGAAGQPIQARVETKTERDLRRITFKTPQGNLILTLPADMAPGDTVSGMVALEPSGRSEEERARNEEFLGGYFLEMAGQSPTRTDRDRNLAVWTLPTSTGDGRIALVLRDKNDIEVGRADIVLEMASSRPSAGGVTAMDFALPVVGKAGQTLAIAGRFDGDGATTRVLIGSQAAPVVAESPRKVVVQSPRDALGKTQIAVEEGGVAARGEFNHEKARRNNTGKVLGAVLVVGIIGIIAASLVAPVKILDKFGISACDNKVRVCKMNCAFA
jgi:hypothetical protein